MACELDGTLDAYPSYVNRVYGIRGEDGERFVVKFYRPGQWGREAVLDEHRFLLDCAEAEIPVVAPLRGRDGETLHAITATDDANAAEARGRDGPNAAEARGRDGPNAAEARGRDNTQTFLSRPVPAHARKLERPLAVIIQSASAAGKTTLMDAVLNFFPEEERVKYSAMTPAKPSTILARPACGTKFWRWSRKPGPRKPATRSSSCKAKAS